nr:MAG TPA: hypothetical protein [Caudoviricetes sp.]
MWNRADAFSSFFSHAASNPACSPILIYCSTLQ